MREAIKVLSVVVLAIATIVTALAWIDDRPNQTTWLLRTIPIAVAVASVIVFLSIHLKKDLAPDLLRQNFGGYLERNGFCFVIVPDAEDGRCILRIYFQNRFERECQAKVALRQSKPIGHKGPPILKVVIDCPGAAFGLVEKIVALPLELQGRFLKLDVGADATYPHGKGAMLRFRDGIALRTDARFVDNFAVTTSILGALGGMIMFHRPARIETTLPRGVAVKLDGDEEQRVEILWRPDLNRSESVASGPAYLR